MPDPYPGPGWDDFRLVKAVAEAAGLAGAAAILGIDPSTVFRRLGRLEGSLGTPLFERHRTGYAPTPAGEEMVALALRLDEDILAFARRIAGQEIAPAGELRVTTSDSLLVHLLTPIFARFRRAFPEVRLDVVVANPALNLSRRDADVAIRATDTPPETLVGRRVARIAWALYGSRQAEEVGPDASRNWVSLGDDLASLAVVQEVRRRIAPERLAYRVNGVLGLAEAVEAGLGVGYLPCFIGDLRPGLLRLAPPETGFAADLWLLTHPDLRQSPRVRAFLDLVAAELVRRRPLIEGQGGEAPSSGRKDSEAAAPP